MSQDQVNTDISDVDARRGSISTRRMSVGRRIYYALGLPLVRFLLFLLWSTYRIDKTLGSEIADRIIADKDRVYAPCYWHQYHILCAQLIRGWIRRGFRACFLVSGSVDGEVPSRIAKSWGAEIIRGSANHAGALVLRDMQRMMKDGVSIVTTADGPLGPKYEFKPGAVMMARIGGAPLVPLACAADRAWYLNRWDDFMIPKPFARIVLAVGEPIEVPPGTPLSELEAYRKQMEYATKMLMVESKKILGQGGS